MVSDEGPSSESVPLYMYGVYLTHGGKPDDFMDLDIDDVQAMYSAHMRDVDYQRQRLVKDLIKIMIKIEGEKVI